jgi:penicillin-binding protein 2
MPVYNQSRSRIIQIIFVFVFIVIIGQLLNLQVFSSKFRIDADRNAMFKKVIYPDRGIIYDRKGRAILVNEKMFDLVVTPNETKGIDTTDLCNLLGIDTATYKKRIRDIIFKNTAVKPSVFEPLLTPEMQAKLNENIYKFPGFVLQERSVRSYPFNAAGNVLGYIQEVDTGFLRRHEGEGYEMGDYAGYTGLERSYEKVLMGKRGVKVLIRDKLSRLQGSYGNGIYDSTAVAGKALYSSIDIELQQLGEKLMSNKVGSIVAINPKTGGVLCMISAPTYNPNYITGSQRRKHLGELLLDPRLPLINRTIGTKYSPGSTFKTLVGIIGLSEGVINANEHVSCGGAYYGCGNGKPKCLDPGYFKFNEAIAHSCNTYFATVFRRTLDQQRFGGPDSSLNVFNEYASSFGLGSRLGVDLPSESRGNLPVPKTYRKIFGPRWQSCNIISNSIGQGEVQTTIVQLANVMATIANKGYYHTPHLIDSIEGGDEYHLLDRFKEKHYTKGVADSVFNIVQDGMQSVMEFGTGAGLKVPGITICGKTGTVENYAKVNGKPEKQKNHSFFGAFAPRENPKIAIAVICENAGFGATYSGPIASLLIEKYLKDSIAGKERKDKVESMAKTNLIPTLMKQALAKQDSIKRAKEKPVVEPVEDDDKDSKEEEVIPASPENNTPLNAPAKDSGKKKPATIAMLPLDEKKRQQPNKRNKA